MSTAIDYATLPEPQVFEELDFEVIFAARKNRYIRLCEEVSEDMAANAEKVLALESEPLTKMLQEDSYREMALRQRINEAAAATMLAYATDADLDAIGATPPYHVERLLISRADDSTTPPTPAVWENDSRYRERIALSFEGYSTAGSKASYRYHVLSADAEIKDVDVATATPGVVDLTVLHQSGTTGQDLLDAVFEACNAEKVRPLCDTVNVRAAEIIPYQINATLFLYDILNSEDALVDAQAAAQQFADEHLRLGHNIHVSAVHAALQVAGVQRVELSNPVDTIVANHQAPMCGSIQINIGGEDV